MVAILLGITSLPSVSASLSWKEFAFVQSNLGWLCLILVRLIMSFLLTRLTISRRYNYKMSNYKLFGRNYWGLDEMVNMSRITLVSGVIWVGSLVAIICT